jgi:hypothetical protein
MRALLVASCLVLLVLKAAGQHDHHMSGDTTKSSSAHAPEMEHRMDTSKVPMSHSFSLNLPMNRNGSGTAWQPDATPMYGYMWHTREWMFMAHGNIALRYTSQDATSKGSRGDSKIDAPNWFMLMGQRRVGMKGLFHFNTMMSLDAIFGGNGYPLLFQTGESYKGQPLIDRQHPHDLFSELSVGYTQSFSKDFDAFIYVGYPGEPALGPTAFMHRASTANNPDAALGHHWQDATHIVYGVATVGLRYKIFKLDGSIFTGREPDENRYNFDKPRFDSYSYRLTVNPSRSVSMQVSKAFIKSPEALNPTEDIDRTTASVTHVLMLPGENHFLTTTAAWGYNSSDDHQESSFILESNFQLDRFALYGRYETVEKSSAELGLTQFDENSIWIVSALTLGTNYTFLRQWKTNFSLGAQGTLSMASAALDPTYGNNPLSFEIYMRVSPTLIKMGMGKMSMK